MAPGSSFPIMHRRRTGARLLACLAALLGAALWLAVPVPAAAQTAPAGSRDIVADVRVEGAQRVEADTVKSYMTLRAGDPFEEGRLDQSLKALFATGLFADVTLQREGSVLVVKVVENPIINRIAFEGNKRIEDDQLKNEVQLRSRVVYTRTKVQSDVKRLLDVYRRTGRFGVTVEPKIIQLPQNRVDLVFEINEGDVTYVQRIAFIGNQRFTDSQLRSVIQTKEKAWYRFLSSDDTYDQDRLGGDRELLRKYYLQNGYADFRVTSAVSELTPDKDGFVLTFTVDEGERYKFNKLDAVAAIRNVDVDRLRELLQMKPGDWYDVEKVEETIKQMTDHVGQLGYAFVEVTPNAQRNADERTIDLVFEVREGPRVYVERIDIVGNVRTLDRVVRREFRLSEGDAFNSAKLRRSRQRIQNLGFFDKVQISNERGSAPDLTVIKTEVSERSTGELSFGAGFSTTEKLLGDVSIRERNLLGRGQDLRLGFTVSKYRQEIDLAFTEPYFLDRNLSAGFDVFHIVRDVQDESSFDERRDGFVLRTGFQLSEYLRQTVRYTARRVEVRNVPSTASAYIQQQEGSSTTSAFSNEFFYDRRDNRFDPTDGYYLRQYTEFAGLVGNNNFYKIVVGAGIYHPIAKNFTLGLSGETGIIQGIGDEDVRIVNRYFIGGTTLRGFKTAGIGPRDTLTLDALGGTKFYTGTVELSVPLGLPEELGVSGRLFNDFGSLWGVPSSGPNIADSSALRSSAGFGISWRSPFGPIRADLAWAYLKESFDRTEVFRFSFGTRF